VASNPPVYSLRRIRAYDEIQKSLEPKSDKLDGYSTVPNTAMNMSVPNKATS